MAKITREQVRLEHEVLRLQALVRATQRAVALPPPAKAAPGKRTRTPPVRARKVIAQLRLPPSDADGALPQESWHEDVRWSGWR